MTQQERVAWYTLCVAIAALVGFGISIPLFGLPRAGAALSILALIGLVPVLFWRQRTAGEVWGDERDRAIHAQATKVGTAVFWLFFVAGCMMPYMVYGTEGKMPVELAPIFLWLGCAILSGAQAVAMILLYRRGHDAQG